MIRFLTVTWQVAVVEVMTKAAGRVFVLKSKEFSGSVRSEMTYQRDIFKLLITNNIMYSNKL